MRIGDTERGEVAQQLAQALAAGRLTVEEFDERTEKCWTGRTAGDLADLIADLPESLPLTRAQHDPAAQNSAEPAPPSPPRPAARLAGGLRRVAGPVIAAAAAAALLLPVLTADDAVSVFGSRVVQIGAEQERAEVGTIFGSVTVVVPADAQVSTAGWVLFGSVDCASACDGSGARPVVVDGRGGFGSIDIVRADEPSDQQ
jgi:hypothetical protein